MRYAVQSCGWWKVIHMAEVASKFILWGGRNGGNERREREGERKRCIVLPLARGGERWRQDAGWVPRGRVPKGQFKILTVLAIICDKTYT